MKIIKTLKQRSESQQVFKTSGKECQMLKMPKNWVKISTTTGKIQNYWMIMESCNPLFRHTSK